MSRESVAARARSLRQYGIVIGFIALFVWLSLASPAFLSLRNLSNILDQSAPVGIIALGTTLVVISGAFDLSTGAIMALSGVVAAFLADSIGVLPAMAIAIGMGAGLGLLNGLLVTVVGVNSFVATLASSLMIRGVAALISGGLVITVADPFFRSVGRNKVLDVTLSAYLFLAIAVIAWILLSRSVFGRRIYAVGGNAEAARLSGIRVGVVRTAAFTLSGICGAIAGIVASSRVAAGQADAGVGIELTAIAGVVIGGTSILGGEGAIWRTMLGVLFLALIGNGFDILGIDPFLRSIFQGAIIVLAVSIDALSRRPS